MQKFFVYIIFSESSNIHYLGHTNNLEDRIIRHNQGRNKFTKGKGPGKLISYAICASKSAAYRLEMKLKSFKDPEYAIKYLSNFSSEHSDIIGGVRGSNP